MARKKAEVLKLTPETWGERVNRAYRRGRRLYGFGYEEIASRISQIDPTTSGTLVRLNEHDDIPSQARTRKLAWMALLAYGFDPADPDFGLDESKVPLVGTDVKKVKELLDPRNYQNAGSENAGQRRKNTVVRNRDRAVPGVAICA